MYVRRHVPSQRGISYFSCIYEARSPPLIIFISRSLSLSPSLSCVLSFHFNPPGTRRFFGRFLLGQLFYLGGVNNILQWEYNAALVHMKITNCIPGLSDALTRILFLTAIIMQLVASVTFILGIRERLSALILLLFLVPVTFLVHDMWVIENETTPVRAKKVSNAKDYKAVRRDIANFPTEFDDEFVHFFKNCQIMGGLVLFLVFTESEGW